MKLVRDHGFVMHFEDVLDPDSCAEIIQRFDASPEVRDGRVFHMDHGDEQNTDKISRDLPIPTDGDWAELHNRIHGAVGQAIHMVLPSLPSLQVDALGGTGYKIQHYRKGEGHFTWHVDSFGPMAEHRLLALILYLNDVEDGGETEFHHQELAISPRTGQAILFPTAWTHLHRGNVPASNDKYVISSFFEFPRTPVE